MPSPAKFFLIFFAAIFFSSDVFAYRNASVMDEAIYYREVEQLIRLGLIDKKIEGQRPWPRLEFARLAKEARKNLDRIKEATVEVRVRRILKDLEKEFKNEIKNVDGKKFHPFARIDLEYLYLDSPQRRIPPDPRTTSQIDALLNPLVGFQSGRTLDETHNLGFESRHFLDFNRHLAFSSRINFLFRQRANTPDYMEPGFDELYLRTEFKNIGVQVGRDELVWGFGPHGGLFHSLNATPLDMFRISNISPISLGIPIQATYYFGVLEKARDLSFPSLSGAKISFQPLRDVEIGLMHVVLFGGANSASAKDQRAGAEFNWGLPFLKGTQVYYEIYLENFEFEFDDEAIHRVGVLIPIDFSRQRTLRAEFLQSGFKTYRDSTYTNGWTHNHFILGDPIGPGATGIYLTMEGQPTIYFHYAHTLALEERGIEKRLRFTTTFDRGDTHRRIGINFGYERVKDFNFVAGQSANNYLAGLKFTINH